MSECLHDVPMTEPCKDCCGTQGRLPKLTCHKCESLQAEIKSAEQVLEVCHPEVKEWFERYGVILTLGQKVKVLSSFPFYEACYDEGVIFTVVNIYVDDGGVNIGLNDGHNEKYLCESDGYRLPHLAAIRNHDFDKK